MAMYLGELRYFGFTEGVHDEASNGKSVLFGSSGLLLLSDNGCDNITTIPPSVTPLIH